jgi:hypothetical protein
MGFGYLQVLSLGSTARRLQSANRFAERGHPVCANQSNFRRLPPDETSTGRKICSYIPLTGITAQPVQYGKCLIKLARRAGQT